MFTRRMGACPQLYTQAGKGIGRRLLAASEAAARERGAETMTLHVFESNRRARRLYESADYSPELLRYIKPIGAP